MRTPRQTIGWLVLVCVAVAVLLAAIALVALLAWSTGTGHKADARPGPETRPPATSSLAAPAVRYGAGLYKVGRDLEPGTYRSTRGYTTCSWERLRDLAGEMDSIIALDRSAKPMRIEVLASDGYVRFAGRCTWTRQLRPGQ